jgi:cobalamin biosynthesis protein CbiG
MTNNKDVEFYETKKEFGLRFKKGIKAEVLAKEIAKANKKNKLSQK